MLATVTSKGQITIPAAIREKLGIKAHDKLDFVLDGHVLKVKKVGSLFDFMGSVKSERVLTFEEERAEAKKAVAERVLKEME